MPTGVLFKFWIIGEWPNFLETIVLKALKECLFALNFILIWY